VYLGEHYVVTRSTVSSTFAVAAGISSETCLGGEPLCAYACQTFPP